MIFDKRMCRQAILLLTCTNFSIAFSTKPPTNNSFPVKSSPHFLSSYRTLDVLRHGHTVVQLGGYWSSQGEAQDISIRYLFGNHYTVSSHGSRNGLVGLGYYIDGLDKNLFELLYGINGFYLAKTSVSGTIIQEDDFANLSYNYKIQQVPIYFAAKAIIKNKSQKYNVTLDAGIGPNFMHAYHYREASLTDYIIPNNSFASRNNVALSAMAGIGLRLNRILGQAPLECGYRFLYFGQGNLAMNNNQLLNTLKTGNTFGNAILCSITV